VNPDADEVCDDEDVDEDCDGAVDDDDPDAEGKTSWYADDDSDGYGDPADSTVACDATGAWTADQADDCDDSSSSVNPDGDEVCNGYDDDCDDLVDDEDDDVSGTGLFFADADGDGFGDATVSTSACSATAEHPVANDEDCDDGEAAVNPNADEACNERDDDCDGLVDDDDDDVVGTTTWYVDGDGDGYGGTATTGTCTQPSGTTATAEDCDDGDAEVHPGADEVCNGSDDDCDGLVDDDDDDVTDGTTWYVDGDGDGHGGTTTTEACVQPSATTATESDCDDTDAAVSPDADETCNDVDDDCDGLIDDDDTVMDATTWYGDGDGDGYGSTTVAAEACSQPSGTAATDDDCDDTDAEVHPAGDEICNGTDDDCDGLVDDDDDDVTDADTWYVDADGDGYGDADSTVQACDEPSDAVSDSSDCDDDDPTTSPGETEVCGDGLDNDCDASSDAACALAGDYAASAANLVALGGATDDEAGTALHFLGDMDGDGLEDFATGAPKQDDAAGDAGTVYVLTGALTGTVTLSDLTATAWSDANTDKAGEALGAPGDVDGDGFADLLIGAKKDDQYGSDAGLAWLVLGPASVGTADLAAAAASFHGPAGGEAGYSVAGAGDQDGDGLADVLVGAHETDAPVSNAGSAYVVLDPANAGALLLDDAVVLEGVGNGDKAGSAVAGGSDLDGDGWDDLLVGAREESTSGSKAGAFYLLRGPVSGDLSLSDADEIVYGPQADARLGESFTMAGDVDGDGYADFAVGAPEDDENGDKTGTVYLFAGPASGLSLAGAGATIVGTTTQSTSGSALAAGNVDGDGYADLLIGSPNDDTAATDAGLGALFYGPVSGSLDNTDADASFYGSATGDEAGTSVALGDWTGNGLDDVAVGAKDNDDGGSGAGGVWIWFAEGI